MAVFGGITPDCWRDSTEEAQQDALRIAQAVEADFFISLGECIRVAMLGKKSHFESWVSRWKRRLPEEPPLPPEFSRFHPGRFIRYLQGLARK